MRLSISILGLVAGAAALSACGGDRASMLAKAESDCVGGAAGGAPSGMNAQRLCSCVVTKIAEGKTDAQVREIFAQKEAPPEAAAAIGECTVAEMKAAGK